MSSPAQGMGAEPAAMQVLKMSTAYWVSKAMSVIAEVGIADRIGEGAENADELAAACGLNADALYRTLRSLAAVGLFTEARPRQFALTALGRTLRAGTPDSMRDIVIFMGDRVHWRTYEEMLYSLRTGLPGAEPALGKPAFEYLADHPETAAVFDKAMSGLSRMVEDAILAAYDFSGYRTIADIAGGAGRLLMAILEKAPNARGILFDVPHVLERAKGLPRRVQPVAGDFFQSVPANADLYYLKNIIHDWDDHRALTILRNCHRAMQSAARLLIIEAVVPPGDEFHLSKLLDLEMLMLPGGRERTEEEFGELLARAGFTLERVVRTESHLSLLEAAPV